MNIRSLPLLTVLRIVVLQLTVGVTPKETSESSLFPIMLERTSGGEVVELLAVLQKVMSVARRSRCLIG